MPEGASTLPVVNSAGSPGKLAYMLHAIAADRSPTVGHRTTLVAQVLPGLRRRPSTPCLAHSWTANRRPSMTFWHARPSRRHATQPPSRARWPDGRPTPTATHWVSAVRSANTSRNRTTVIPMPTPAADSAIWTTDLRTRLDELLDEYRASLHDSLDGLTEKEARLRLVPSKTTLLGLLKHATYVEGIWFDHAISGRTYTEIGIASTPDRSFTLKATDTIASIQKTHRSRCDASRHTMAGLTLDAIVPGRGDRSVWALHLQVLRELAQHAGHADILREQIIARRAH